MRADRRMSPSGAAMVLAGCALLLAGCSMEAIPASMTPREMVLPYLSKECARTVPEAPRVEVKEAGRAPLQKLRFVASKRPVSVKIMLEAPFADAHYVLRTAWIDATVSAGQGCHTFEVSGSRTGHIGDSVVGVVRISAGGPTTYATDALDTKSYQVERDLAWALGRADPVLPIEPVGEGAVWRVRTNRQRSGEVVEVDTYYRLTSRQGTRIVLEVMRTLVRPEQRIRGPRGFSKKVAALTTNERGVLDFDLRSRPIPNARFFNDKGREVGRIVTAYR